MILRVFQLHFLLGHCDIVLTNYSFRNIREKLISSKSPLHEHDEVRESLHSHRIQMSLNSNMIKR